MSSGPSAFPSPLHLSCLPSEIYLTKVVAPDYAKCAIIDVQCRWGSCGVQLNCLSAIQQHYHKHSARAHEDEHQRGNEAEYICRVKQCATPIYTSMGELSRHIDQAHIGIIPIPCPLKDCLYTFIANNLPAFLSHLDTFHRNHLGHSLSPIDNLKPLANPRQHALPNNPPQLPQSTTSTAAAYPHPVIPRKRRNLTRTLSAISAAGSSMQSLSSSPRKRTRLSTRVFDPPAAPIAGPSSALAPVSDSDGEDWDDTSITKCFDDLPHSATAWNAPDLLVRRAKGPRWDKQRALGSNVVVQSTRKFPPTKQVQLSSPPLYKGRQQPTYKVQPELMTTFTAMMERHKRLEDGGLFNADVETWVTREGAEV